MITMPKVEEQTILEKYTTQPTAITSYDEANSFLIKYDGKWLKGIYESAATIFELTTDITEASRFWLYKYFLATTSNTLCWKRPGTTTIHYVTTNRTNSITAGTYNLDAASTSSYYGIVHLQDFNDMKFYLGTGTSTTHRGSVTDISVNSQTNLVQMTVSTNTTTSGPVTLPLEFWRYQINKVATQYPIASDDLVFETRHYKNYDDAVSTNIIYNGTIPGRAYEGIEIENIGSEDITSALKGIWRPSYTNQAENDGLFKITLSNISAGSTRALSNSYPNKLGNYYFTWVGNSQTHTTMNLYKDDILVETLTMDGEFPSGYPTINNSLNIRPYIMDAEGNRTCTFNDINNYLHMEVELISDAQQNTYIYNFYLTSLTPEPTWTTVWEGSQTVRRSVSSQQDMLLWQVPGLTQYQLEKGKIRITGSFYMDYTSSTNGLTYYDEDGVQHKLTPTASEPIDITLTCYDYSATDIFISSSNITGAGTFTAEGWRIWCKVSSSNDLEFWGYTESSRGEDHYYQIRKVELLL